MQLQSQLREWRHNPCLMRPFTAILLLVVALLGLAAAVLKFPSLVLGWLLAPVLSRAYWVVEFWYPTGIGKWFHITLVRWIQRTNNKTSSNSDSDDVTASRGFHSRSIETRVELVPGRVFVHVLPQWLDNLGYLVVCLPPTESNANVNVDVAVDDDMAVKNAIGTLAAYPHTETTPLGDALTVDPHANASPNRIVAFCVDCGDANEVAKHVRLIRQTFYDNQIIHVQSILSTHKHHDHTAGNLDMLKHPDFKTENTSVKLIFGGAVDKVPGCNFPLANGDKLPLPHAGCNDMNDVVEVEAVATPAHTRGSLTYVLRPLATTADVAVCLFTGDTVFSGGGGVPFEADFDMDQESSTAAAAKLTAHSFIQASAAANAMERCLAEVLFRSVPILATVDGTTGTSDFSRGGSNRIVNSDGILVFPGHEYTNELLARQLATPLTASNESCRWKNMAPGVFFQTASQFYVSLHRRTLPSSTGKLLTIPSTVSRERQINPHLRSLKQRGTVVISALKFWHRNFCLERVLHVSDGPAFASTVETARLPSKSTRSNTSHWNLNAADVNRPIFTTLYAADLETLIHDLSAGRMDAETAATKLKTLSSALDKPVTGRRPIPGTLPTSRNVYRGLLGLVLMGSSPTALTQSDSKEMNLPAPLVGRSSDLIRVSKRRLIAVLHWLGLLDDYDGQMIIAIIGQLWKETKDYTAKTHDDEAALLLEMRRGAARKAHSTDSEEAYKNDSTDVESIPETDDDVELGALKWIIYGIPTQQPKSWLSSFCMPCFQPSSDDSPSKLHSAGKSGMQRNGGELVRHDIFTCPLCRDATGRAELTQHIEEVNGFTHQISSSMCIFTDVDTSAQREHSSFIEVSPSRASSIGRTVP